MSADAFKKDLGQRVRSLRERFGYSQSELAELVGWSSQHVIVGNIESGEREVKAWELLKLSEIFRMNVSDLLSQEQISAEEKKVSQYVLWRKKPDEKSRIEQESRFFSLIRRYLFLEQAVDLPNRKKVTRNFPSFPLDLTNTTFQQIYSLAETCRDELGLGSFPAKNLISVLEDEYQVKIIYLELDSGQGSAACTRDAGTSSIMLNTNEVPWRRNFSIAHELFHIVTWNKELFEQMSFNRELTERNEQYANAFAAGLLMPAEQTKRLIEQYKNPEGKISFADLIAIAREFEVSTDSLIWRLVGLKLIEHHKGSTLVDNQILKNLEINSSKERRNKNHFRSWRFVRLAYQAHARGRLSKSQFANYLGVSLIDLDQTLSDFGLAEADGPEVEISNS